MGWIFLLVNLLVVLCGSMARFWPRGFFVACPVPTSLAAGVGMAVAAAAALLVLILKRGREPLAESGPRSRRPFWELTAAFPVAFAYEWLIAPPLSWRFVDWLLAGGMLAAIAFFLWRDRASWRQWGLTGANFVPAVKRLAVPTLIFLGAPALATAVVGSDFQPGRMAVEMAAYPLYALGQLAVFQLFLVRRLKRICASRGQIVAVSAGLFGLMHWPNGVLMAATAAAGAVWTWVYLGRPNLYALALSMGLSAAWFANVLPRDLTQNLRTGPRYVQRKLDAADHREPPYLRRHAPWRDVGKK